MELDQVAARVLAVGAVRDLVDQALEQLRVIDPAASVGQLLDARRALRQCLGALDTYEQAVVDEQRRRR